MSPAVNHLPRARHDPRSGFIQRRLFLIKSTAAVSSLLLVPRTTGADREEPNARLRGMLLGSLIGDAAGGPVEFAAPERVRDWMPATRDWDDRRQLTNDEIEQLASSFQLLSYETLRPEPRPYAHWTRAAAAGTVTDDSRHKFMLMAALREARENGKFPIGPVQLAQQYLRYCESAPVRRHPAYASLCEEWLREYNQAARWIAGDRGRADAAPTERLWGGVPTNAGQMVLLPLAGAFYGDPESAYRAAFQLGFMDNGTAKDLNSAIVAGLAAALAIPTGDSTQERWKAVRRAMSHVDPYRYAQIPWVERPIVHWLDFAEKAVGRADQVPKRLFEILEQEAEPRYYWDAHFVLASAWAIMAICGFDGLASLQLALDFGHDTDSTAQLVGAFAGAVYGEQLFPLQMRSDIIARLEADYLESVDEWTELLVDLQHRERYPVLVASN